MPDCPFRANVRTGALQSYPSAREDSCRPRRQYNPKLQPQLGFTTLRLNDLDTRRVIRPKVNTGLIHVSQGRGKADSSDRPPYSQLKPGEQRPQLNTPFAVEHRMDLVQNDRAYRSE
jgi:hypothetical protein